MCATRSVPATRSRRACLAPWRYEACSIERRFVRSTKRISSRAWSKRTGRPRSPAHDPARSRPRGRRCCRYPDQATHRWVRGDAGRAHWPRVECGIALLDHGEGLGRVAPAFREQRRCLLRCRLPSMSAAGQQRPAQSARPSPSRWERETRTGMMTGPAARRWAGKPSPNLRPSATPARREQLGAIPGLAPHGREQSGAGGGHVFAGALLDRAGPRLLWHRAGAGAPEGQCQGAATLRRRTGHSAGSCPPARRSSERGRQDRRLHGRTWNARSAAMNAWRSFASVARAITSNRPSMSARSAAESNSAA